MWSNLDFAEVDQNWAKYDLSSTHVGRTNPPMWEARRDLDLVESGPMLADAAQNGSIAGHVWATSATAWPSSPKFGQNWE